MFNCWLIRRRLYDFLIRELSLEKETMIRAHLEKCSSCRKRFSDMEKILSSVPKNETPFLNESFWKRFDTRLDLRLAEEQNTKIGFFSLKFSLSPAYRVALAVAAVILLVVFLNEPRVNLKSGVDKFSSAELAELVDNSVVYDDMENVELNHTVEGYYDEVLLQLELETA